jgi:hypothetical protein
MLGVVLVQEAHMRRAFSQALSVLIVAAVFAVGVKLSIDRINDSMKAPNVETTSHMDGLHVALPNGVKSVPAGLVPLP